MADEEDTYNVQEVFVDNTKDTSDPSVVAGTQGSSLLKICAQLLRYGYLIEKTLFQLVTSTMIYTLVPFLAL